MGYRTVLMILAVLLVVSACGRESGKISNEEPEIVMGRDCGLDYFPCCAEDPPCSDAQKCCYDPNNSGSNYCSDDCGCGKMNQFCCAGNQCSDGLACLNGRCAACGNLNEPCCPGGACSEKLTCGNGSCVECGVTGNPCCAGEECFNADKIDNTRAGCLGGACAPCGSGGNAACPSEPVCNPGNLFNNDVCYFCGGSNQPCCNELSGVDYQCDSKKELKCDLGFCS